VTAISNLTRRQRVIYEFLLAHQREWSEPPTLDQLCAELGLSSRGSLHKHIQALVDAGLIEPMAGKHRGIRLKVDAQASANELPFLGKIAAGRPVEAFEIPETIEVPAFMLGHEPSFVLQAKGDSMMDAGILDGDLLVIAKRSQARNLEIVVALVDGTETTLKRIEQQPGKTTLHAENDAFEALSYAPERVEIQGVLIGQMRSYR
jgi:repressor LexA